MCVCAGLYYIIVYADDEIRNVVYIVYFSL